MRYRRFRTQDGKFLDALLTAERFTTPAESHRADHEAGYGVGSLTVVEADSDPWDGVSALVQRATPKPDLDATRTQLNAILDKADADITAAELKTLTLRALRRLRDRGRL